MADIQLVKQVTRVLLQCMARQFRLLVCKRENDPEIGSKRVVGKNEKILVLYIYDDDIIRIICSAVCCVLRRTD
jgi:hypothetical protein